MAESDDPEELADEVDPSVGVVFLEVPTEEPDVEVDGVEEDASVLSCSVEVLVLILSFGVDSSLVCFVEWLVSVECDVASVELPVDPLVVDVAFGLADDVFDDFFVLVDNSVVDPFPEVVEVSEAVIDAVDPVMSIVLSEES